MNKRGQSLIEYALIVILIVLGIVTMGPYVLRSVNAHFKLWDDGVQDSFTESLNQSNVVPSIITSCSCSLIAGSCGATGGGVGSCGPGQREYDYSCNPVGCNGAGGGTCANDPTCCVCPISTGCGDYPLPATAAVPCPASFSGCGISGTCVTPPASNNCYYGYQMYAYQCGPTTTIQCIQDSNCPLPACQGLISPGATACPNVAPQNGPLLSNVGITYVANLAACNAPCQYYCNVALGSSVSSTINATGTACVLSYQIAPVILGQTNNQSFTICAGGAPDPNSKAVITSVSIVDASTPPIPNGCGSTGYPTPGYKACEVEYDGSCWDANPGENCQLSVIY